MKKLSEILDNIIDFSVHPDHIDWTLDQVKDVEKKIGACFSEDYIFYLQHYGCDYLKEGYMFSSKNNLPKEIIDFDIGGIFGLYDKAENLIKYTESYKTILPAELFPIAFSGGGDLICMAKRDGRVFYWKHDATYINESTFYLADSFSDFIFGFKKCEMMEAVSTNVEVTLRPEFEMALKKAAEKYK